MNTIEIGEYENEYEYEYENECPICMELFEPKVNMALTDCGHAFCIKCFIIMNYKSNKCPICRQHMQINNSCQNIDSFVNSIIQYNQQHQPEEIPIRPNCFQRIINYFNSWTTRQIGLHGYIGPTGPGYIGPTGLRPNRVYPI